MIFLEAINNVGLLLLEVSNLDKDYISGSTLEKKLLERIYECVLRWFLQKYVVRVGFCNKTRGGLCNISSEETLLNWALSLSPHVLFF
jgi:hypothetical protein